MSIEVRNVSKSFGNHRVLDRVNLTVRDGELVALLGPSGSGKTTLLRIIAGLESIDDQTSADGKPGEVLFHGQSVEQTPLRQRQVGFVFQHYALFKHMTVFENVAFGLRVRARAERPSNSEIQDRVTRLLKLIQLEGFGNRYPSQLSGGQRQRVALARALAIEPKVLLLDEPFGALDAKVRADLRNWLRRLHDEIHVTTVLVTHDQDEALEVSDRVVVMNHGRIEQAGTPEEVFHHPATEFVMDFLGQVNVFRGRVEQGQVLIDRDAAAGDSSTKLYVRPHELELQIDEPEEGSIQGSIERIVPAGSCARVLVQTSLGQSIQVDVPFERARELELSVGLDVFVTPRRIRTFVPEYMI